MIPKVPEKFPLQETAFILCFRCKARFHPTFLSSFEPSFAFFTCPRCLGQIPVDYVGGAALARKVRGCAPGLSPIPINHHINHNPHFKGQTHGN